MCNDSTTNTGLAKVEKLTADLEFAKIEFAVLTDRLRGIALELVPVASRMHALSAELDQAGRELYEGSR